MRGMRGPGRPKGGYRTADGKRVPGVTTITGRYKDSGGLVHWAWSQGRDGLDYRATRDAAADAGSCAHDMIEAYIHGVDYSFPADADAEMRQLAETAYGAFERWARVTEMEVLATETPLVSEEYRYGGTLDAIGYVDGALAIIDWKTSNGVYPDYIVQVAAYANLWLENKQERVSGAHLLRVGREHGQFAHHSWPEPVLDKGWESFRLMRELYELDKQLKKAV